MSNQKPAQAHSAPTTPQLPSLDTVSPLDLLHDKSDLLANELAAELQTPKEILAKYNIKQKDFSVLAKTPRFKRRYSAAKVEWATEDGAKELFARKCRMAADASVVDIYGLVKNADVPPANRIEAHKHLSNMGQLAPSKVAEDGGGNKHSIIINIGKGQGREPITVEGSVVEHDGE